MRLVISSEYREGVTESRHRRQGLLVLLLLDPEIGQVKFYGDWVTDVTAILGLSARI